MFKRILVANRGEIAKRIIKAAKEMGIETVAVYSQADENSPHLKDATQKVCIGASQSSNSYLNIEAILQTARQYDCQALHPGFGFLAENATFAYLCEQHKITFIGPSASSIKNMGDKALARKTMKEAGLDIIPGSEGVIANIENAKYIASDIGYPVILKATAGGGGKGMRICSDETELEKNFIQASNEAEKAFGNADLYMEKFIKKGKHIEFQILADTFGNVIHLGERECSVQRNHQKLIEESPSPVVSKKQREELGAKITKAVAKVGYKNAGTIEFLMDGDNLYFMEMNTRLQVEHPVTEMITSIDIVKWQIAIAAHCPLDIKQEDVVFKGHSIECRINAEDPENNFKPSPGTITKYLPPKEISSGTMRIDTFVEEGYTIPPYYDSMICKLIVWNESRDKAIESMKEALQNFIIEGIPTTISLHIKIMQSEAFKSGKYDTDILKTL